MKQELLTFLPGDFPWEDQIHCYETLDSTNLHLMQMARAGAPGCTAVLAERQTQGRGRLGRSFHSPQGQGIYLSFLLRPNCPPQELMHLTCAVAVSICDAVASVTGLRPGIKWINDLVVDRHKIAGILTQLLFSPQGQVEGAIVGVGLNCLQGPEDFPPDLPHAGSLAMALGRPVSRPQLAAAMLRSLRALDQTLLTRKEEILEAYRRDCVTLGQPVAIFQGEQIRHGLALDIDNQGALLVKGEDGSLETVSAGEVSVRGLYGYV